MHKSTSLVASIAAIAMAVGVAAQYGPSHGTGIESGGPGVPNYDPNTGDPYLTQSELAHLMRGDHQFPQRQSGPSYGSSASQQLVHQSRPTSGRGLHSAPSYHHEREHHNDYNDQNSYAPTYPANSGYRPSGSTSQSYSGFGRPGVPHASPSSGPSYDDDSSSSSNSGSNDDDAGVYGNSNGGSYGRGSEGSDGSDADGDDDNSSPMGMSLKQSATHHGGSGYHDASQDRGGRSERDGPLNGFGDSIDGFAGPGDSDMNAMMREKSTGESSSAHDEIDDEADAAPRHSSNQHGYQHDGSTPLANVRKGPTSESVSGRYAKHQSIHKPDANTANQDHNGANMNDEENDDD